MKLTGNESVDGKQDSLYRCEDNDKRITEKAFQCNSVEQVKLCQPKLVPSNVLNTGSDTPEESTMSWNAKLQNL
jgi:hypothetical protein